MLAIIFTSHLFFDCFMSKFSKADKNLKLLLIDQFLHITIIIVVWFCLRSTTVEIMDINNFLDQIGILVSFEKIISIILIFLLIGRPTSIFIEKLLPIETKKEDNLSCEQKENKKCNEEFENFEQIQKNNFNYGSFIGILERITIVLLAILNLWSSIALVFTAKSIARFKQLEDKNFAQKYLIGTLLSLSITLFFLLVFL